MIDFTEFFLFYFSLPLESYLFWNLCVSVILELKRMILNLFSFDMSEMKPCAFYLS